MHYGTVIPPKQIFLLHTATYLPPMGADEAINTEVSTLIPRVDVALGMVNA